MYKTKIKSSCCVYQYICMLNTTSLLFDRIYSAKKQHPSFSVHQRAQCHLWRKYNLASDSGKHARLCWPLRPDERRPFLDLSEQDLHFEELHRGQRRPRGHNVWQQGMRPFPNEGLGMGGDGDGINQNASTWGSDNRLSKNGEFFCGPMCRWQYGNLLHCGRFPSSLAGAWLRKKDPG